MFFTIQTACCALSCWEPHSTGFARRGSVGEDTSPPLDSLPGNNPPSHLVRVRSWCATPQHAFCENMRAPNPSTSTHVRCGR
jgi:hypothetical protein